MLHELDSEKFKLLNVTLFNKETQQAEYFNAESNPDISCLLAVRASMAIPGVFKSVIINGNRMSDGGQAENAPLSVFVNRAICEESNSKDYWHGGAPSKLRAWYLGAPYFTAKMQERNNIHALGPNVMVVPHKGLGILSIGVKPEVIQQAKIEAAEAAKAYANLHKDSAYYTTYDSEIEALASLSDEERVALHMAKQPIQSSARLPVAG